MMTNKPIQAPVPPPQGKDQTRKVERALEIRESSAKVKQGKPLAFPPGRIHR